jgi:HSP90 family molecular chaperone
MVADKITLVTRRAGSGLCSALGLDRRGHLHNRRRPSALTAGTTITLDLKNGRQRKTVCLTFATSFENRTGRKKKYSDFIAYPILMKKEVHKTAVGAGRHW